MTLILLGLMILPFTAHWFDQIVLKHVKKSDLVKIRFAIYVLLIVLMFVFASGLEDPRTMPKKIEVEVPMTEQIQNNIYVVTEVIDGDTIDVTNDGKTLRVRLIGIDSPEIRDASKPVECFGKEASDFLNSLILSKEITMEADPTQSDKDKYDRLLRYIFIANGENINQTMVANGYAFEYTYKMPYKYQAAFKAAQAEARKEGKGLWAKDVCNDERSDTKIKSVEPALQATETAIEDVQTNKKSTETVKQEPEAVVPEAPATSGFSCGVKKTCGSMSSCNEAYYYLNTCGQSKLDKDKDGVPCESLCG